MIETLPTVKGRVLAGSNALPSPMCNVPEMMVVLLVCYVAMVGAINQFMQWLEARLRVPGFGQ